MQDAAKAHAATRAPRTRISHPSPFAVSAHAVSFPSATAISARPCIGANGKRSDNGGDHDGDGACSDHDYSVLRCSQQANVFAPNVCARVSAGKSKRRAWLSPALPINCLRTLPITAPSDGFTRPFQHSVLSHIGCRALPSRSSQSGDHVNAHDLYKTVPKLHGTNGLVSNVGDGGNAARMPVARGGIYDLHCFFGRSPFATQVYELFRLLRRVA